MEVINTMDLTIVLILSMLVIVPFTIMVGMAVVQISKNTDEILKILKDEKSQIIEPTNS